MIVMIVIDNFQCIELRKVRAPALGNPADYEMYNISTGTDCISISICLTISNRSVVGSDVA